MAVITNTAAAQNVVILNQMLFGVGAPNAGANAADSLAAFVADVNAAASNLNRFLKIELAGVRSSETTPFELEYGISATARISSSLVLEIATDLFTNAFGRAPNAGELQANFASALSARTGFQVVQRMLSDSDMVGQLGTKAQAFIAQVNAGTATFGASLNNTAPTDITSAGNSVLENAAGGTVVSTLATVDADLNNTHTYAITGGTGAALFEISGNKIVVKDGAVLDFETATSYTLTIQTKDQGGLTYSETVTIAIQNQADQPGELPIIPVATIGTKVGAEVAMGTDGHDVFRGAIDDDSDLSTANGGDVLVGKAGFDTYYLVNADGSSPSNDEIEGIQGDSIERIIITNSDSDEITFDAGGFNDVEVLVSYQSQGEVIFRDVQPGFFSGTDVFIIDTNADHQIDFDKQSLEGENSFTLRVNEVNGINVDVTQNLDNGAPENAALEGLVIDAFGEDSVINDLNVGAALTNLEFTNSVKDNAEGPANLIIGTNGNALIDTNINLATIDASQHLTNLDINIAETGGPNDLDYNGSYKGAVGNDTVHMGDSLGPNSDEDAPGTELGAFDGGAGTNILVIDDEGSIRTASNHDAIGNSYTFKNFQTAQFTEQMGNNGGELNAAMLGGVPTFDFTQGVANDLLINNLAKDMTQTVIIGAASTAGLDFDVGYAELGSPARPVVAGDGQDEYDHATDRDGNGTSDFIVLNLAQSNTLGLKGDEIEKFTFNLGAATTNTVDLNDRMLDLHTVVITGTTGDFTLDGNSNADSEETTAPVEAGLTLVDATGAGSVNVTISDETVSDDGATIRTASGNDLVFGGNGNDTIETGAGDDTGYGQAGNDTMRMGSGSDRAYGEDGNDTIYLGSEKDFAEGGAGDDDIFGEAGDDSLEGNAGSDELYGGEGNDILVGGADGDLVDGGVGADIMTGDGPLAPGVAATCTFTVGGVIGAGDVFSFTIGSNIYQYFAVAGDTALDVAAGLAAAVNVSLPAGIASVVAVGGQVLFTGPASGAPLPTITPAATDDGLGLDIAATDDVDTVTVNGTYNTGDQVSVTVGGTTFTHTVTAGQTNVQIATALELLIEAGNDGEGDSLESSVIGGTISISDGMPGDSETTTASVSRTQIFTLDTDPGGATNTWDDSGSVETLTVAFQVGSVTTTYSGTDVTELQTSLQLDYANATVSRTGDTVTINLGAGSATSTLVQAGTNISGGNGGAVVLASSSVSTGTVTVVDTDATPNVFDDNTQLLVKTGETAGTPAEVAGADTFVVDSGSVLEWTPGLPPAPSFTGYNASGLDVVTDFQLGIDKIDFADLAVPGATPILDNHVSLDAGPTLLNTDFSNQANYEATLALVNSVFASNPNVAYVSVMDDITTDVYVFADTNGDNLADQGVILVGLNAVLTDTSII